jgi:hypothetical protein
MAYSRGAYSSHTPQAVTGEGRLRGRPVAGTAIAVGAMMRLRAHHLVENGLGVSEPALLLLLSLPRELVAGVHVGWVAGGEGRIRLVHGRPQR